MNIKEQEIVDKHIAEASTADYARLSDKELKDLLRIFAGVSRDAAKPVVTAITRELSKRRIREGHDPLEEAKIVPFKKLEQAWTRTKGDKDKQAKLIKKHDLKQIISTVRPGEIKLGVKNKLLATTKAATAAGLDLDDELIFITNNPLKIIYPKKSTRRPEGEEIKEEVKVKKDLDTLRLEKIVSLTLKHDNMEVVENFVASSNIDLDSTATEIKEAYSKFIKEYKNATVRELRQMLFKTGSDDADAFRRVLLNVKKQDSPATNAQIKKAKKIIGNRFGKDAFLQIESSAKWIIYDKKTGKQLKPSMSWRKWQGAKMAAAKIGPNAEPTDAAWYHDNKAKLMGEATDLEEAVVYRDIVHALRLLTDRDGIKVAGELAKKDQDAKISSSDLKKAKAVFSKMNDKDAASIAKKKNDKYFPKFGVKALTEESVDLKEGAFDKLEKKLGRINPDTLGDVLKGKIKLNSAERKEFDAFMKGARKMFAPAEETDLEEAVKWWTVTITKKAGKLFKGQTVDVKANNSAEAIKKGIKQMKGDPVTVPSGSVDAVLGESLKEAVSQADIKKILAAAKKAGGDIKGNQIDFGMGAVIDVSIEKGKIKLDAGRSNGVEYFKTAKDAVMAFESVDFDLEG